MISGKFLPNDFIFFPFAAEVSINEGFEETDIMYEIPPSWAY